MISRPSFLLICALSFASGIPTDILKRTKSGVPLFLVTDFQIIERYADDTSSSDEFSGNSLVTDNNDRKKREATEKFTLPRSLLEYMSNTLAHRIRYPEEFEQVKKAKLTNRLQQKPFKEEDFNDNHLRILRSAPEKSPLEPAVDRSP